ncbi:unnamed protein product, partial [Caenorhabditis brenneri]
SKKKEETGLRMCLQPVCQVAQCSDAGDGVYKLPSHQEVIQKRNSAEILLKQADSFYSVAWCQQSSDILEAPIIKLVVGGETGRLYVVDYETMKVEGGTPRPSRNLQ